MEICFESHPDSLVAHLQCYLDRSSAENFKFVLGERLTPDKVLILDLEKLVNIDSFGLDALLAIAQKALEMNTSVKLARVSADMKIVLDITKVYRVFEIYSTIEDAVASCAKENEK